MGESAKPLAVYALTPRGAERARQLAAALPGARLFLPTRLGGGEGGALAFDRLATALAVNWEAMSGHLVFAATGIVVRAVAPLLADKKQDPAVVCLDQEGRFAVSLLSGHLGGANALAGAAAAALGGQAVITTATDSAGLPALEVLARDLKLAAPDLKPLSGAALALLEGEPLPVWDPGEWLWPALAAWPGAFRRLRETAPCRSQDGPLVWVDWRLADTCPQWLLLRPPALMAGVGCNRGASKEEILQVLRKALADNRLAVESLAGLASVTAKADEPGLLAAAENLGLEIIFFSREELSRVPVPNPSLMVQGHMGTASVSEAAAILASAGGGLLVPKVKSGNVTVAVAKAAAPGPANEKERENEY